MIAINKIFSSQGVSALLLCIVFFSSLETFGQRRRQGRRSWEGRFRHVKGITFGEAAGGLNEPGFVVKAGGGYYIAQNSSLRFSLGYERGKVFFDHINRYVADFGYAYTVLTLSDFLFINAAGLLSINYNVSSASEQIAASNGVNAGLGVGLEIEVFPAGNFSFFVSSDQRAHLLDVFGRFRNYNILGLRLNFK